jgi:beta-fructofuranosidase
MFRLDDQWVWDSWIADDGDLYHLFFLKALRAVGSPSERDVNATVGHAVTRDLVSWDYLLTWRTAARPGAIQSPSPIQEVLAGIC